MAETRWGRGGTHGYRTNRRGAFYYSCSSHGGFVIDGRCLTPEETEAFTKHLPLEEADAVVTPSGKIKSFRGPENWRKQLRYYPSLGQKVIQIPIFFAEEDCDWCVPVLYAGICIEGMTAEGAQRTFNKYHAA
tara:strand:+ start:2227 stop:2625 length:399 start_codon:yes stop_codon:yes gene_type:complete